VSLIPERIVEAVHGPAVMYVGTRNERLHPAQAFVIGAVVQSDRETVTFFIPESRSTRIVSDLTNNGRVALAVSLVTHEAYQLKGGFIAARPATAQECIVQGIYRSKLLSALLQAGYPEQIIKPFVLGLAYTPAVAISFRVEEIFLQTPGPEAGKKIN
jgi:hypothetical protein